MSIAPASPMPHRDLLMLADDRHCELVNGQLVERQMSHAAVWIAMRIAYFIMQYLERHPIGDVYSEGASYRCFPDDPQKVRRADVSFLRTGRMPLSEFERGHCSVAPDLAIEVISPNDLVYDVSRKLEDYFVAGVPLVWLVNPELRTITVYRDAGTVVSYLHASDELTGDDVLPGFTCRVGALFPPVRSSGV